MYHINNKDIYSIKNLQKNSLKDKQKLFEAFPRASKSFFWKMKSLSQKPNNSHKNELLKTPCIRAITNLTTWLKGNYNGRNLVFSLHSCKKNFLIIKVDKRKKWHEWQEKTCFLPLEKTEIQLLKTRIAGVQGNNTND